MPMACCRACCKLVNRLSDVERTRLVLTNSVKSGAEMPSRITDTPTVVIVSISVKPAERLTLGWLARFEALKSALMFMIATPVHFDVVLRQGILDQQFGRLNQVVDKWQCASDEWQT